MGIVVLSYASHNNYPGGAALWQLHVQEAAVVSQRHTSSAPARVHIDVAAAQQVCDVYYSFTLCNSAVKYHTAHDTPYDITVYIYILLYNCHVTTDAA